MALLCSDMTFEWSMLVTDGFQYLTLKLFNKKPTPERSTNNRYLAKKQEYFFNCLASPGMDWPSNDWIGSL